MVAHDVVCPMFVCVCTDQTTCRCWDRLPHGNHESVAHRTHTRGRQPTTRRRKDCYSQTWRRRKDEVLNRQGGNQQRRTQRRCTRAQRDRRGTELRQTGKPHAGTQSREVSSQRSAERPIVPPVCVCVCVVCAPASVWLPLCVAREPLGQRFLGFRQKETQDTNTRAGLAWLTSSAQGREGRA
jgi:hypothetical protein